MPAPGPERAPRPAVSFRPSELAEQLGGTLCGADDARLTGVRGLEDAGAEHLSFLANRRYVGRMRETQAGAVLIDRSTNAPEHLTLIRCDDPYAAFARALTLFHPQIRPEPGVHTGAWVHPAAEVHPTATVEAFAWVGPGAVIGAGSWVEAGVRVGAAARVGAECRLMANSVVCDGCELGDRVWLNPGAVVGAEGFGFAPTKNGNIKIPQVGKAIIADDVELGANACVDRAAMGDTRVGRGTKTDNLVQIGHAAQIGEHGLMVAYSGVAGSSRLGDHVILAARAAVLGHITVGDGARVGVASAVRGDVAPGAQVSGVPAIPHRTWLRAATAFQDLPDLSREVRRLQARVQELEAAVSPPTELTSPSSTSTTEGVAEGFDAKRIMELLPHRYPFLMIDRVLEVEPGVRAVGIKCVTINEPHFQGHFPDHPIMPGVLIAEAFAQMAGLVAMSAHPDFSGKAVYLMGMDRMRFRKPVTPGDQLVITCEKIFERRGVWKFTALAEVNNQKVANGEIMATVADRP